MKPKNVSHRKFEIQKKFYAKPDDFYGNEVDNNAAKPDCFKTNRTIKLNSKECITSCDKVTSKPPMTYEATKKQMSTNAYKLQPKMLNKFSTNLLFYSGAFEQQNQKKLRSKRNSESVIDNAPYREVSTALVAEKSGLQASN